MTTPAPEPRPGYLRATVETSRKTWCYERDLSPRAYRAVMTAVVLILVLSAACVAAVLVLLVSVIVKAAV